MRTFRNARHFTVIEMLVVIAIIAILAGMLLATITTVQNRTKARLAHGDIQGLSVAFERYKEKFGKYPPVNDNTKGYISTGTGNNQGITRKFIKLLTKHNLFSYEASQMPGKNDADLFRDPWGIAYIVEYFNPDTSDSVPGSLPSIAKQRSGIYIYSTGGQKRDATKSRDFVYLKDD